MSDDKFDEILVYAIIEATTGIEGETFDNFRFSPLTKGDNNILQCFGNYVDVTEKYAHMLFEKNLIAFSIYYNIGITILSTIETSYTIKDGTKEDRNAALSYGTYSVTIHLNTLKQDKQHPRSFNIFKQNTIQIKQNDLGKELEKISYLYNKGVTYEKFSQEPAYLNYYKILEILGTFIANSKTPEALIDSNDNKEDIKILSKIHKEDIKRYQRITLLIALKFCHYPTYSWIDEAIVIRNEISHKNGVITDSDIFKHIKNSARECIYSFAQHASDAAKMRQPHTATTEE